MKVQDVRNLFKQKLEDRNIVHRDNNKSIIEEIGLTFLADEPDIFGTSSDAFAKRELQWYLLGEQDVNMFPGGPPTDWCRVAGSNGETKSNYGSLILYSGQFEKALQTLKASPLSKRAIMVYTSPDVHNTGSTDDFVCTNSTSCFIRNGKLVFHVTMRSNDLRYGYPYDLRWAKYLQERMAEELEVECGDIIWTASTAHLYEKHWDLIKE